MSNLKDQLIRLGSTEPALRPHIRPILDGLKTSQGRLDTKGMRKRLEVFQDKLDDLNVPLAVKEKDLLDPDNDQQWGALRVLKRVTDEIKNLEDVVEKAIQDLNRNFGAK